jgi:predicted DsbA family dithiol-disulfide isomerase
MPIEVFAELTCPFTHLALRRIVQRRTEGGRVGPLLRIRPWPLELVNGEPLDPEHVAHEVIALREQVSPDLFAWFEVGSFPSTSMPGFRLVEAAYAVDDSTGEAVGIALRNALFEEGRNIADAEVIAGIAAAHDVEVPSEELDEAVRRAYEEGQRRGVEGSPHFFVAGWSAFCPLLDIRKDAHGELSIGFDEQAAHDLLDGWFASEAD